MSEDDLSKGSNWNEMLTTSLNVVRTSIVVLTPENLSAPWLLWEAGKLSGVQDRRRVCTLLVDIEPPLTGPFGQYQATIARNSEDVLRLCSSIAESLESSHAPKVRKYFEKFWPDLEKELQNVSTSQSPTLVPIEQLIPEILKTVQALQREQGHISTQLQLKVTNRPDVSSTFPQVWSTHIGPGVWTHAVFSNPAYAQLIQLHEEYGENVVRAFDGLRGKYYTDRRDLLKVERIGDGVIRCGILEFDVHYESPGPLYGKPRWHYGGIMVIEGVRLAPAALPTQAEGGSSNEESASKETPFTGQM
jgi:hypothetical protein